MSVEQHDLRYSVDTTSVEQATEKMKRFEEAADRASGQSGGRGVAGLGQSMLQVGRIVQDFDAAGLQGILNNFEGMALALGMGAGVAGAVTVAAVAFQQFMPQLKEFLTKIGLGTTKKFATEIEELKHHVEELGKKPLKMEADWKALDEGKAKLEALMKAQNALNRLLGKQTSEEQASGQAVEAGLTATAADRDALSQLKREAGTARVETSPAVKAARDQAQFVEAVAQQAAENVKNPQAGEDVADLIRIRIEAQKEAKAAKAAAIEAERKARTEGENTIGGLVDKAQSGTGKEQTAAREQLASFFESMGSEQGRQIAAYLKSVSPAGLAASEMTPEEERAALDTGGQKAAARMAKQRAFEKALGKEADQLIQPNPFLEGGARPEINLGPRITLSAEEREKARIHNENMAAMQRAGTVNLQTGQRTFSDPRLALAAMQRAEKLRRNKGIPLSNAQRVELAKRMRQQRAAEQQARILANRAEKDAGFSQAKKLNRRVDLKKVGAVMDPGLVPGATFGPDGKFHLPGEDGGKPDNALNENTKKTEDLTTSIGRLIERIDQGIPATFT